MMIVQAKISFFISTLLVLLALPIAVTSYLVINSMVYKIETRILTRDLTNMRAHILHVYQKSKATDFANTSLTKQQNTLLKRWQSDYWGDKRHLYVLDAKNHFILVKGNEKEDLTQLDFLTQIKHKTGKLQYFYQNKQHIAVFFREPIWHWLLVLSIGENEIFVERAFYIGVLLFLTGFIFLLLLLSSYYLTKNTAQTLQTTLRHLKAIEQGDWDNRIPITTQGEIGQIQASINAMLAEVTRSHAALCESEQRFKSVFNNAAVGIGIFDRQGRFINVNSKWAALFDYTVAEFRQKTYVDVTHPEDVAYSYRKLEQLLAGEIDSYQLEKRCIRKDGHIFWGHIWIAPVYNTQNELIAVHGFVIDITRRKQVEREKTYLASIIESTDDIAVIKDLDLKILATNPAFAKAVGKHTAEELVGKTEAEIFGVSQTFLHNYLADEYKAQRLNKGEYLTKEERMIYSDHTEHLVLTKKFPVFDDTGKVIATASLSNDITARKQTEAELRKLSRAVDQSASVIVITDLAGQIEFVNPAFSLRTGYSPAEAIGNNPRMLKSGRQPTEFYQTLWSTITNGQVWQGEMVNKHKNDKLFWESVTISPVKDNDGHITHYVAVKEDITQRKQIEEALQKSEARLNAILNSAAAGIAVTDERGRLMQFNTAWVKLLGYPREELLQMTCFDVMHPTDREATFNWHNQLVHHMINTYRLEKRYIRKNKSIFWGDLTATAVFDQAGVFQMGINIVIDITERKRAEEALRKSEERLRRYFELPLIGMATTSLEKGWLQVNDKLCEILGYPREELMRLAWTALTHPEDIAMDVAEFNRVVRGETEGYSLDKRFIRKNGQVIYASISVRCIRDSTEKIDHFVALVQDITQRKQAEEALKCNQTRLAEAQRIAHVGSWVAELCFGGPRQKLLTCSDETYRILGVEPATFKGTKASLLAHIPPEEHALLFKAYHNAVHKRQNFSLEHHLIRPDGEKRTVIEQAEMEWDERGQPLRLIGTIQDITDRKHVEEALRSYQFVVDKAAIQIFWMDDQARFYYVNEAACQTLGFSEKELLNMRVEDIDPDFPESIWPAHWRRLKQKKAQRFESQHQAKDGRVYPVEISANYIVYQNNEYNVAFVQDISQRKQTEQELKIAKETAESANRAKSTFLANMSHELRTPLNSILGYAQILGRDKTLTEKQKEGVHIIRRSGEHLLTLINDMLDLSKIEAGKLELVAADFHLVDFLKDIVDLFKMRAEQKGIALIYEPMPPPKVTQPAFPAIVQADEKRLRQILLNLLSNAIKFTTRGQVYFKAIYHEGKICFEIEDSGCGIAAEQLETIFLPFHQVGNHSYQIEGTGLGLPISKKLVEMMGGRLYVKSEPARGSVFWFEVALPTVSHTLQPPTTISTHVIGFNVRPDSFLQAKASIALTKVLVVDDQWENRAVLVNFLTPLGFTVLEAIDGVDALAKAKIHEPQVIIMDLKMPMMDGFECTRRLRQIPAFQITVIIALSASVFEEQQQESLAAGCNAFLTKPIDTDKFLQTLATQCHIEWIYESPPITLASIPADIIEPTVLPTIRQITTLFKLAKSGKVKALITQAEALAHQDPLLQPFAAQVCQLARRFQIQKLKTFLNQYIEK